MCFIAGRRSHDGVPVLLPIEFVAESKKEQTKGIVVGLDWRKLMTKLIPRLSSGCEGFLATWRKWIFSCILSLQYSFILNESTTFFSGF